MHTLSTERSLKTTWVKAIFWFLLPVALILGLRWAFFEPYVIPSGSMIPKLLVHDHILVNKWAYGLRLPFSESWLISWDKPSKGDIVVFKYPRNVKTFFIKRVVATEGDVISVKNGVLIINNQEVDRAPIQFGKNLTADEEEFSYFEENLNKHKVISRSFKMGNGTLDVDQVKVPEGFFYVVGDNRDQSSDSRVWGFVPMENLMGKASLIWLSCENTLPSAPMVCDPNSIRWGRLFNGI